MNAVMVDEPGGPVPASAILVPPRRSLAAAVREGLRKLLKSKLLYGIFTVLGVVWILLESIETFYPKEHPPPESWLVAGGMLIANFVRSLEAHLPRLFMQGVVQSVLTSAWVAWTVYFNRRLIKDYFQPQPMRVLAPMSIAVTPLIFGDERNVWEDEGLNLQIDFSSTGSAALEGLRDGKCQIAIASDYAISKFLADPSRSMAKYPPYLVFPFAHIKNEIKLLTPEPLPDAPRQNDEVTVTSLKNQRAPIAYLPNSIHQEFLEKLDLVPHCKCTMTTTARSGSALINFMAQTSSGEAKACVMIEPYFIAFEKAKYTPVTTDADISWYMCMVVKRDLLIEHGRLARQLARAVTIACQEVSDDWDKALRCAAHFVLEEFTGIDEVTLRNEFKLERGAGRNGSRRADNGSANQNDMGLTKGVTFALPTHEQFMLARGGPLKLRPDCVFLTLDESSMSEG